MAKFRVNPELVRLLLPVVIPIVEDLAKRTETTVDDKLVSGLKSALENPVVLAFLLSLLENGVAPTPFDVASSTRVDLGNHEVTQDGLRAAGCQVLVDNADLLSALFSVAKV